MIFKVNRIPRNGFYSFEVDEIVSVLDAGAQFPKQIENLSGCKAAQNSFAMEGNFYFVICLRVGMKLLRSELKGLTEIWHQNTSVDLLQNGTL
jgi:hypothetical protein